MFTGPMASSKEVLSHPIGDVARAWWCPLRVRSVISRRRRSVLQGERRVCASGATPLAWVKAAEEQARTQRAPIERAHPTHGPLSRLSLRRSERSERSLVEGEHGVRCRLRVCAHGVLRGLRARRGSGCGAGGAVRARLSQRRVEGMTGPPWSRSTAGPPAVAKASLSDDHARAHDP
jgi:hypothetical protein